ncbi:hypothetical protein LX32DRAFT_637841 [Colletotrichum zoysiae]|uniref:Rhodopsin domain-containing protein n=1 Tax=Colletotrichum zoysiae TaxID=1216348 RepID=A0AAD9HME5_9PEZI|nr:hypothetical protein LX32DRAFT_637841 [Colletotrichum zoysiae]
MVENRGPELLAVNIFFVTAATVAIALRCFVRAGLVRAFGSDDWLMVLAWVFFACYSASSISGVHYGTGRHHKDINKEDIPKALECWWYCYLFYCLSMVISKMSIAYFLMRITTQKVHRWVVYLAMLFTVISGIIFFFVTLFQCHPISFFWNKDQAGGCVNPDIVIGLAYAYSASSVISDFAFAILPAFIVVKLQVPKKTKYALIPLLMMGCVASSAVLVRFGFLMRIKDPDFLWATLDIAIWSSIEQGLAITAGSLATLRPLLKIIGHRLGWSTKSYPIRGTEDMPRRPSAFAALDNAESRSPTAIHKDVYDMTYFPCTCCGTAVCQKKQSESSRRRRTSMAFSLKTSSKNKKMTKNSSEENLSTGRSTRDGCNDTEQVVPKSFVSPDEQKN